MKNRTKYLITAVKLGFTLVALYLIFLKLTTHDDLSHELRSLSDMWLSVDKLPMVFLLYVLMLLNWFTEVVKWRLLMGKWVVVSMLTLSRAVLSGVTVSLFTPNRVGEFAGRVFHLRKRDRVFGALSSIVGSMNQLMITVFFGSLFLIVLSGDMTELSELKQMLLFGFCIVVSLGFLLVYFNIGRIPSWLNSNLPWKRLSVYLNTLERFNRKDLVRVSILSCCRYVVFTSQYVILLIVFGVDVAIFEMVTLISVMYLVTSIIPGFAISELALRGSVAMQLFPDEYSTGVLGASISIWLINIVSPAIIGAISFLYIRSKR